MKNKLQLTNLGHWLGLLLLFISFLGIEVDAYATQNVAVYSGVTPYLWAWNKDDTSTHYWGSIWPGDAMTSKGNSWYLAPLNTTDSYYIIITGTDKGGYQTSDLGPFSSDVVRWYATDEDEEQSKRVGEYDAYTTFGIKGSWDSWACHTLTGGFDFTYFGYTYTYTNMAAGSYHFGWYNKSSDSNWQTAFDSDRSTGATLESDGNIKLTLASASNVTFYIDPANFKVFVRATSSCTTPTAVTVTPTSSTLTLVDDASVDVTTALTGGITPTGAGNTYQWSVTPNTGNGYDGASSTIAEISNSTAITNNTATFKREGVYTVSLGAGCSNTTDASGNATVTVNPDKLYVTGPLFDGGTTWSNHAMTKASDSYTYTYEGIVANASGAFNVKTTTSTAANYYNFIPNYNASGTYTGITKASSGNHNLSPSSSISVAVGDRLKITVVYNGVDGNNIPSYDITLEKTCTEPSADFTVTDDWGSKHFADAEANRKVTLTSATGTGRYYNWWTCSDANCTSSSAIGYAYYSTYIPVYTLPGTYYYQAKAGCDSYNLKTSAAKTVTIDAPQIGITGNGVAGDQGNSPCYARGDGDCGSPTNLTWTKDFIVTAYYGYKTISIHQRYKATSEGTCSEEAGWSTSNFIPSTQITFDASSVDATASGSEITLGSTYNVGDRAKITITMTAYNAYTVKLERTCAKATAGFAATGQLNAGDGSPWAGTASTTEAEASGGYFANDHRTITLTTSQSADEYQWTCVSKPGTAATAELTNSTSQTATATVNLPGTYTFKVSANCTGGTAVESATVTVNVPYPLIGADGYLVNGSWNHPAAASNQLTKGTVSAEGYVTYTRTFSVSSTSENGQFVVIQQYRLGCEANSGWDGYAECGGTSGNKINVAGTLTTTGLNKTSDNNFYPDFSCSAGDKVKLTVVMKGYDYYDVTLATVCEEPEITADPSATAQSVCKGATATALSVTATGTDVKYQWFSYTDAAGTTGETSVTESSTANSSYTPATSTVGTLYYRCKVTACSTTVSSAVSGGVTVKDLPSAPVTSGTAVCSGTNATVSVTSKTSGATIDWYDAATAGNKLNDTSSDTYTITGITAATTVYAEAVLNGCSSTTRTSAEATLKNVTITQEPASAHEYQPVTFTASSSVNSWTLSNPTVQAYLSNTGSGTTTVLKAISGNYTVTAGDECNTVKEVSISEWPDNCNP